MAGSFTEANDVKVKRIGAWPEKDGVRFRVWAPGSERVNLVLLGASGEKKHDLPMKRGGRGYFELLAREASVGSRYLFKLDHDRELPDPASRYQPEGPHRASQVISSDFPWSDEAWKGHPLEKLVIYELHVGTFTSEGTFEGVRRRLSHLKDLGINAIEIMPVAQFPGARNWGYDGVGLFAAQNTYAGKGIAPLELKRLVDACHEAGIAVFLDVVYNHLGPEGNYLGEFGPYFQSKYRTPWGDALNFDGEYSDEVRAFFLQNARQWLEEFHFDGLRLDAVHAIFDTSAKPFLEELGEMKKNLQEKLGRELHLIAESDANDCRILRPSTEGGLGMDGQWADDLHHAVHSLVTGENQGYYSDYGDVGKLAEAYQSGVIFDGEYSEFRHRSHGRSYAGIDRDRLVVCSQNHDQIGNRMLGERLSTLVGPDKQRLAAACVFLSPFLPLIFMGEEFGERSPFLYFVDHTDKALVEAVRKGRREEFSGFDWQGEPPDPASPETFERCRLKWDLLERSEDAQRLMRYYRCLIAISKWIRTERLLEAENARTRVLAQGRAIEVSGSNARQRIQIFFSFSSETQKVEVDLSGGPLEFILNSWDDVELSERALTGVALNGPPLRSANIELKPFSATVVRGPQI